MIAAGTEFISIPEWGRRLGVSKDSAYRAARLGEIPGCFAIGRLYRVNWSAFVERSGLAGGHQLAEEVGRVPIPPLDHVRVDPQRGCGVRVA
jgi:excisionase family DNA binding protein